MKIRKTISSKDFETLKVIRKYNRMFGILPKMMDIAVIHGSKNKSVGFKFANRMRGLGIFSSTPEGYICRGKKFNRSINLK